MQSTQGRRRGPDREDSLRQRPWATAKMGWQTGSSDSMRTSKGCRGCEGREAEAGIGADVGQMRARWGRTSQGL